MALKVKQIKKRTTKGLSKIADFFLIQIKSAHSKAIKVSNKLSNEAKGISDIKEII